MTTPQSAAASRDLGIVSVAGQPYVAADLVKQFAAATPRDVYTQLCRKNGCKVVSSVLQRLPDKLNQWHTVEDLDLSHTYVGPRGVVAVAETCKLFPKLTALNVSDNYLNNESIWHIAKMAVYHPSLSTLDVSCNAVSWTAGMSLLELATKNAQIRTVVMHGTSIKPNVIETVNAQLRRNSALGHRKNRHGPNPCNHPTTIRQRALKRFFKETAQTGDKKEEYVMRKSLGEGLKEMWRVSGREDEIQRRTPQFYETFCKRATSDKVDWEMFLVLVTLDGVGYQAAVVAELKDVFQKFDIDNAGFVEVRDLPQIMTELNNGVPPNAEEVQAKFAYYDLDDTMTLSWDEFLLLMYDHGPVVGDSISSQVSHTPIHTTKAAHH